MAHKLGRDVLYLALTFPRGNSVQSNKIYQERQLLQAWSTSWHQHHLPRIHFQNEKHADLNDNIVPSLRLVERILYDQMVSYLESHCILPHEQHGFRAGRSTDTRGFFFRHIIPFLSKNCWYDIEAIGVIWMPYISSSNGVIVAWCPIRSDWVTDQNVERVWSTPAGL